MTTTQKRARKGGEIGTNGLHYQGGAFLPSTKLGKMARANGQGQRKPRPYWAAYQPFCAMDATTMRITANDQALAYFKVSREEVQAICDRYNAGER